MIRFPCVLYNPISVETWHFLPFQRALVYLWFFGEIPVEGLIFIFLYKVFKVVWLCQLFFQDLIICVLLHLRLVYINKTKTYSPTKRKEMGKNDIGFPFRCRFDPFGWVRSRPDDGFTFSRGAEQTMSNGFWLECNTYLYSHMLVFLFYSVLLLYFFLQSYKDILIHWILINVKIYRSSSNINIWFFIMSVNLVNKIKTWNRRRRIDFVFVCKTSCGK